MNKRNIDEVINVDYDEPESSEVSNSKKKKVDSQNKILKEHESSFDNLEDYLLDSSWKNILQIEFSKDYFKQLKSKLKKDSQGSIPIFPRIDEIFNAFNKTSFEKVKVVILGQDPYPTPGIAHGLAFSVKEGVSPPQSLKNIFKELQSDIKDFKLPKSGNLLAWCSQGVLLLNATLTVLSGQSNSHESYGWQKFTDTAIQCLSRKRCDPVIFILWGGFAQKKEKLIDTSKHKVLKCAHPSPLSANKGFFGAKIFSKCNDLLISLGQSPIDWNIPLLS